MGVREPDPSSIFWGGDRRGIFTGGRLALVDWGGRRNKGFPWFWIIAGKTSLGMTRPFAGKSLFPWLRNYCGVRNFVGFSPDRHPRIQCLQKIVPETPNLHVLRLKRVSFYIEEDSDHDELELMFAPWRTPPHPSTSSLTF